MVEMDDYEDIVELGGNIELSGFSEIEGGSMIILKKIIGNYVRGIADKNDDFEKLNLYLKRIHETEGSSKYEVKAILTLAGKIHNADFIDRNIFTTVDRVLRKIQASAIP